MILFNRVQVKNSRNSTNAKPPTRGGPSKDKDDDDDASTAGTTTTEGTLVDADVKDYQVSLNKSKPSEILAYINNNECFI